MLNRSSIPLLSLPLALLIVFAFPLCVFAHNGGISKHKPFTKNRVAKPRLGFRVPPPQPPPSPSPPPPPPSPPPLYVPPQVATLQPNDKIAIAGDSVTYLGFQPGGWVSLWQHYVQTYYPSMNLQFFNYGFPRYRSADLLNTFSTVLQNRPTVVLIFIGVNDAGYGIPYLSTQYSNIQSMINQCKACPSVRTIVLISPFCWGEQHDGENPFDATLDQMTQDQAYLAALNSCPFVNLRALWSSAESIYNQGDYSSGVLTMGPPGVHPSALGSELVGGAIVRAFGE